MFSTEFLSSLLLVPEVHCNRACIMLSVVIHSNYSNRFCTYRTYFWKNAIKPPLGENTMSEIKYANVMLDMSVSGRGAEDIWVMNICMDVYIYMYS